MTVKSKILIVEDQIPTAMAITALLSSEGYDTRVAMTGARAIKMAQESGFDLITLDVDLPDMNGFEVCFHLKKNPLFQTPIVFVSGRPDERDKQRGLELGAVDYISKPFEPFEFKKRLLSHIKRKEMLEIH